MPENTSALEFVNFIIFCAISSIALLVSGNLLSAFFALELLGSTTLYAFFAFSGFKASSAAQTSSSAAQSCVYQFVLNFFGSIFFYTALGFVVYYTSTLSLSSASSRLATGGAQA